MWWLIVPAVAGAVVAGTFALFRPAEWEASQAILVRDEVLGSLNTSGRFDSAEDRKSALETILEMARSPHVVRAAMLDVGPPPGSDARWPTDKDVERMQKAILVRPPRGTEFGQTDVVHVTVRSADRQRAGQLAVAVCRQLDQQLRQLRSAKARSIQAELQKAVHLAEADLAAATEKLRLLESSVGQDLGELRSLSNSATGDSNLRSTLNQIASELRLAETAYESRQQQLANLLAARDEPDRILAMPNSLLESQPALRRLKEGLIDAQLHTARLLGRMSELHPDVQAAKVAEKEMRDSLRRELEAAVVALRAELDEAAARAESLRRQHDAIAERLNRLAQLRADYSNRVEEVARCTEILKQAQTELADARATERAAQLASLITMIDQPVVGSHPVGLGRTAIAGAGLLGGLLFGAGLLLLQSPIGQHYGRRWTDWFPARRQSDRLRNGRRALPRGGGRRMGDPLESPGGDATRRPAPPDADAAHRDCQSAVEASSS